MPGHWAVSWAFRPSLLPGYTSTVFWESPLLHLQASYTRSHLCPSCSWEDAGPPPVPARVAAAETGHKGALPVLSQPWPCGCRSPTQGQLSCSQACKPLPERAFSHCILLSTLLSSQGCSQHPSPDPRPQCLGCTIILGEEPRVLQHLLWGACPIHGEREQCLASGVSQSALGTQKVCRAVSRDLWAPPGKLRSGAKVSERLPTGHSAPTPGRRVACGEWMRVQICALEVSLHSSAMVLRQKACPDEEGGESPLPQPPHHAQPTPFLGRGGGGSLSLG